MPSLSFRGVALLLASCATIAACGGDDSAGDGADGPRVDASDIDAPDDIDAPQDIDAGVDAPPPVGTVQCPTAIPAPADGVCDATMGTGAGVMVRGHVLVETGQYLDGAVLYQGDRIVCVGCDCGSEPEAANATVIDCGGAVVSPGLVNAHDHLNYNERAPLASTIAGGTRYQHRHDWRGGVSTPANQHGTGVNSDGMRWNELRHILGATTSIAASTYAAGGLRNLDELESRDRTLGFEQITYEVFALGDGNETLRNNCMWNYVYGEFQMSLFPGVVTHTSEGINNYAQEEFRCQSMSVMNGRDYVEHNVGHIHGVGLHAADYYNMARDDAKLVWSPRSNISLYGNTAQAPIFHRLGGTIALGTDWTYSGSATLPREMACAASLNDDAYGGFFTDEEIWKMATINGAKATGTAHLIGSLAPGKIADLAVFRPATAGQLHRAVIDALTDDIALVVRDGDLLYGETDVATALGQTCDPIDVCGEERRVCASREFAGRTYAQIAAAVAIPNAQGPAAYPAVFCDTPAAEPTCLPTRPAPNGYTGPAAGDPDGDGIADAADNCPTMFNPIRPIDNGVQPDSDGDGMGDMCDPTPLAADLDGDADPNKADNCPFLANSDQADTDGDNKGNVCDGCPTEPNPAGVCAPPPTTIVAIQNGTVPANSSVFVSGAVVTAVNSSGFIAQDPTVTDGRYAGIHVFTGSAPGVQLGDRVSFAGVTEEYFMNTEVSDAVVVSRTPGAPLDPIALTVAQAATEEYEGVLVRLTDVTQVDNPHTCSVDNPACMDARLWEVNNAIVVWDGYFTGGATVWSAEATAAAADMSPSVTGIMFYRFDRRRIAPREAADITP